MVKVGIVGGTGYTGVELLRLLAQHPQAEVAVITSRSEAGVKVADMYPNLRGHYDDLAFSVPDVATLGACDVVFFATPHGVAHALAGELLAAGTKVIDLSADFRLQDAQEWAQWYGQPHGAPDLLPEAVYGLPEVNREAIKLILIGKITPQRIIWMNHTNGFKRQCHQTPRTERPMIVRRMIDVDLYPLAQLTLVLVEGRLEPARAQNTTV